MPGLRMGGTVCEVLEFLHEFRNRHAGEVVPRGRSEAPWPGTTISLPRKNASRSLLTCRRSHNVHFGVSAPNRGPEGQLKASIPRFLLKSRADLPWR